MPNPSTVTPIYTQQRIHQNLATVILYQHVSKDILAKDIQYTRFVHLNLAIANRQIQAQLRLQLHQICLLLHASILKHLSLKGTVSQEKLLNCGLGEMVWTLTIDRTQFLHFPDQLFSSYNILTISCLDVKPVWSLSETVALC